MLNNRYRMEFHFDWTISQCQLSATHVAGVGYFTRYSYKSFDYYED